MDKSYHTYSREKAAEMLENKEIVLPEGYLMDLDSTKQRIQSFPGTVEVHVVTTGSVTSLTGFSVSEIELAGVVEILSEVSGEPLTDIRLTDSGNAELHFAFS